MKQLLKNSQSSVKCDEIQRVKTNNILGKKLQYDQLQLYQYTANEAQAKYTLGQHETKKIDVCCQ